MSSTSGAALALALVLLAGCLGAGGDRGDMQDRADFHSDGAFDAAVASGAKVVRANADPHLPGGRSRALDMATPALDGAWGVGRYRLQSIHWWGPPGPPAPSEPDADGIPAVEVTPGTWQGFLLSPAHLQVLPGTMDRHEVRSLAHAFLENVTPLSASERAAVIDELLTACDVAGCTRAGSLDVDAAGAWSRVGGWAAIDQRSLEPSRGRLAIGAWWFDFAFDAARLEDGAGEGRTTLAVGSNDVVRFTWDSARTHDDAASYRRLVEALEGTGIPAPDPATLAWTHHARPTE